MALSVKKYLSFDPEEILKLGPEPKGEIGFLTIENISPDVVAFKIRTENEVYLSATPCKGLLGPNEQCEVRITFTNITFQKEPVKLQVLAVPIDDVYQGEENITKLFKRSFRNEIQDQRFTVYHSLGYEAAKMSDYVAENRSKTTASVPSLAVAASSVNSANTWNSSNLRYLKKFFPAKVAYNNEEDQSGSESDEPQTVTPHYQLHMANTGGEKTGTRFPLGRRLLRKFSSIGTVIRDLTEQSIQLRNSQRLVFAVLASVLLCLTFFALFLLIMPPWSQYHRHSTAVPGYIDVSDITDTFIEDRKDMTLDEYLHWKMN